MVELTGGNRGGGLKGLSPPKVYQALFFFSFEGTKPPFRSQ